MNVAALLGLISAISIVGFTVASAAKNPKIFFDPHAIIIVLGGTTTVALLAFPFSRISPAMRILFRKMFGKHHVDYLGTISTIVNTAQVYRTNPKQSLDQLPADAHPFLKDGMRLLVEYGFNADDLDLVLQNALDGKKKRDSEEVKVWHTISRFPPAFGLLGATVGMIAMLQTLSEPGAQDNIGPAMATALVATFFGLVTANLLLIPIAEHLHEVASSDATLRKIIKEGVTMIQEKRHPLFIEEYLKSFLSPKQRAAELNAGGGAGGRKAA
jgi:chemotaxis protein MotA